MDILINFRTFCNIPRFFCHIYLFLTNLQLCLVLFWHKEAYCTKSQLFDLKKKKFEVSYLILI